MKTKTYTEASSSCRQLRCRGAWQRMSLALLLLMLTTMTAWAADVSLQQDGSEWYVNMPQTGTNTLTLTDASITTFKVYDDGGKSGEYSNNCNGNLVLKAPDGYVFQLSGNIRTGGTYDNLTVYDNSAASGTKLIDAVCSPYPYNTIAIKTVTSTGRDLTLNFTTNSVSTYAGLNLTVTLVSTSTEYDVTVDNSSATGGTATANTTSAKVNETVTLTATPESGYLFSGISVTDANNNAVVGAGGWYSNNQATFTMPGSAVTVTPTFTNDLANLSVNMPKTGEKDVTIPSGVVSFKVYDDGGKNANYSQNCDGTLVLTAPTGYVLQLSGSVTLDYNNEKLTVYNGTKDGNDKLIDAFSCSASDTETDIPVVTSTGNVMTLYFYTNNFYEYAGLNLTVTLVDPNTDYAINGLCAVTGGSIAASVSGVSATTAKVNDEVTLTATSESGYMLSGISVTYANNNAVAVTWDGPFYNTATFTMPASAATVTPTFTNDLTADNGLYVNMPTTDSKSITIPSGVQSFKVYDDGGVSGNYSMNHTSTLVLTAPDGYVLQLSGSITTESSDKLTVYDGADNTATKLIDAVGDSGSTKKDISPVASTGTSMTIYFKSDINVVYAGLDLTVTVVSTSAEYDVIVDNSATGGTATANPTSAEVNDEVTLTATPESGYMLSGISVTYANNNAVAVTWDGPFYNTATFTMPGSEVTVTPTFTNNLTADNGLYVNMPKTDSKSITIPSGVQSFKVYDDGGVNGNYSDNCDGTLVLTAPDGYVLQLSGSITTESSDKLTVYDGATNTATKLIDAVGGSASTKKDITTVTSTGTSMTIYFKSDYSVVYAGLDLTVTLIPVLSETTGITDAESLKGRTAQFSRTFTEGVASTICLPFPMTTIPGGKAYEFGGVTYDAAANSGAGAWVATMTEVSATVANTPYLYKADANANVVFSGTVPSDFNGNAGTSTSGDWTFKGTYSRLTYGTEPFEGNVYGFASTSKTVEGVAVAAGEFIMATSGASVPPMRCYLTYKGGEEYTAARGLTRGAAIQIPDRITVRLVGKDGDINGIGTLTLSTGEFTTEGWYSLDGRKLDGKPTKKGLYINNGRKVVIK